MAEKPENTDPKQTQETMMSSTRKASLNVEETSRTVINPQQAHADQLDETVVTTFEKGEMLADETMETVLERPVPGATGNHTKETAMMGAGISGDTQKAPSVGATRAARGDEGPKYEIVRSLGKGGFAWVYLVRNVDLDRLEAMKILNTELAEDEEVLDRFVREAKTSAKFNHQNIVMVYEVQKRGRWQQFRADPELIKRHREPFAYFTMSYVEGQTATDLIKKKRRIPQRDAVRIIIDACAALEYAHGKGVVHRDIKPDNILVDRKGTGIVMDFGIAKVVDQTRQTAAGTFMGTARYVSPEQAMGKEIDARTDLYSLGVALYELATGRVPFDSDKWMTVLYQHINEPPPSPEKFYGDIDRDLRGIILKMLEKKPEDRFQTAHENRGALTRVYQGMGGDDRKTRPIDHIETRRDMQSPEGTAITEHRVSGTPPVRTKIREKAAQPEAKPKSKAPLFGGIAAVAAVVLVAFFLLKPDPKPSPDPPKPVPDVVPGPAAEGRLLINAYPKGTIERLTNEKGETVPLPEQTSLPRVLSLPVGVYKVVVSYDGQTKVTDAFVNEGKLLRVNAEFDIAPERFLLEDLK